MNCRWCKAYIIFNYENREETPCHKKQGTYLGKRWEIVNVHRGVIPYRIGRDNAWLCHECATDKINGYGKRNVKKRREEVERHLYGH